MKNIRNSYKTYKKLTIQPVDIKTYILITTGFIKFFMKKVFEGDEIVLPARMGTFSVVGKKQKVIIEDGNIKGLSPNWVKTKQLWAKSEDAKLRKQLVYNTNEHSDKLRYKFLWSKRRSLVENKNLYSLRLSRANKRELASRIFKGQEYYNMK